MGALFVFGTKQPLSSQLLAQRRNRLFQNPYRLPGVCHGVSTSGIAGGDSGVNNSRQNGPVERQARELRGGITSVISSVTIKDHAGVITGVRADPHER